MSWIRLCGAALGTVALLVAGCGSAPAPASAAEAADRTLDVAYAGLETAFPNPVADEFQSYFGNAEYLMRPGPDGQEPWLAESVEQPAPDQWRITMRPSLTFQSGKPVTAEAVKEWFEFEAAGDPTIKLRFEGSTFATEGDRVVLVNTPQPMNDLPTELANYSLQFYDVDAVKAVGEDYSKLAGVGAYTGPYQISSISPREWVYTANPNYWQGAPALDKIVLKNVPDGQAAVRAIQAGEADVHVFADVTLKPVVDVIPGLHYNTSDDVQVEVISLNTARGPFDDPAVRRALSLSIDPVAVSQKATFGLFPPTHGMFLPSSPFALDWTRFDVAEANRLLDTAGWARGPDGVREKDGTRLEADLISYSETLNALSIPISEQAKAAGFALTPKQLEYQVWQEMWEAKSYTLSMLNVTYGINGDAGELCKAFISTGSFNGGVSDPALDAECGKLVADRSPATIAAVLRRVQEINAENAYVLPVVGRVSAWVTNETWSNARPGAHYIPIDYQTRP
ncbi:MAG: ABC transporter substrate-binding protein [Egibacteraceae bacterium]